MKNKSMVAMLGLLWMIAACGQANNAQKNPHPQKNPTSTLMLSGDWVPENTQNIDFDKLPRIPSEHVIINDVRDQKGTHVNQHNYLVYYNNRYWVMWSDGPGVQRTTPDKHYDVMPEHDRPDQRVFFATSKDGLKWDKGKELSTAPGTGFGWIARGFWVRDGKLIALLCKFKPPGFAAGIQLHAFELDSTNSETWKPLGLVYDDAINNFPPQKIATGEWMMSRRDSKRNVHFITGGIKSYNSWESFHMTDYGDSVLAAEEPYWLLLPDSSLLALFRDNRMSGFLYRSFSTDNGRTWSSPVRTNFPDATSKFSGLRLKDGRYVLVSNPNPKKRDPLTLSISDDGIIFNKMYYLVGGRHVDYPHIIENDGYLLIAFAGAKQTVEVLKIKLADLNRQNSLLKQ